MNSFITTEEFNEAADCSLHNGMFWILFKTDYEDYLAGKQEPEK